MAPRPRVRLTIPLFRALLTAYRSARRRGARQPTRVELYRSLLDHAILHDDRRAMDWFDSVEAVEEDAPETPVPIRSMLRRLSRVSEAEGRPVTLLDLARLVTGVRPRPTRRSTETLPMKREERGLVPHVPAPPPALRPDPPRKKKAKHSAGFHCPECCPNPRSRRGKDRKRATPVEKAESFLASIGGELTDASRARRLSPASGRTRVIDRILEAMLMMHRPNPILVGPSGVGKSTILEGVARRILAGAVPARLRGLRLFRLDANLFRAQAGIIGRIEEFLETLVGALDTVGPAALVIDEVHLLTGTGAHKDDPKGAEQYIRDHLSRGRLRLLGTTTPGEYQRFLAEDRALEARIVKIDVEEPGFAVARRMVRQAAKRMEEHFEIRIPPTLADQATTLCLKHPTGKAMPLAAVDLLDWALARAEAGGEEPARGHLEVALAGILGCEVGHIRQEGSSKVRELEATLRRNIKGQGRAIEEAVGALRPYAAGLKDKDSPAAVLLFAGPTGVGKTESARQIARHLFGSERRLIRVPMADLTDSWAATRLLGSGPGYVGHEKGGWLVRRIRETPACVLLLDEFDRAHPAVRDLFLEAFDNARMVDSRGLEADLRHTIVILTSNLGAGGARTAGFQEDKLLSERERLMRVIKSELSDPLVGRLTAVIAFDPLTEEAMEEILDLKLRALEKRLGLSSGRVVLDRELAARVLARGYAPATGARGLDEALERLVIRPLATRILDEGLPDDEGLVQLGVGAGGVD